MARQYLINDIIKYEEMTKYFHNKECSESLPIRVLLDLVASEVEFDGDYARFIIDRRLFSIADYIYKKSGRNVTYNPILRSDIQNNNIDRNLYDEALESYEDEGNPPHDDYDIFPIIDKMIRDNNWNLLYYLYYKEEEELTKLLIDGLNDLHDRKFFIIQ